MFPGTSAIQLPAQRQDSHPLSFHDMCWNRSMTPSSLFARSKGKLHLQRLAEAALHGCASLLRPAPRVWGTYSHRDVCHPNHNVGLQRREREREEEEGGSCIPFGCFTGLTTLVGSLETPAARNRVSRLSQRREENKLVFLSCRKLQNHAERSLLGLRNIIKISIVQSHAFEDLMFWRPAILHCRDKSGVFIATKDATLPKGQLQSSSSWVPTPLPFWSNSYLLLLSCLPASYRIGMNCVTAAQILFH